MNKRILELAEQAGALEVKTVLNTPPAVSLNGDEIEKFAELIVRECANICYNEDFITGSAYGDEIHKHFGVKQ
jgi:hypothetical protein